MWNTLARPRVLVLALYIASAALVTVQKAILRHSNNVSIFRSASFNLFAGRDLYAAHPEQHFDFYKYSPTFAVLFAPLAYLPFALTFLCWTLLNGLDRKSTRLNSSHSQISYAVFCLKKTTTTTNRDTVYPRVI